jgi:hypothetical protein
MADKPDIRKFLSNGFSALIGCFPRVIFAPLRMECLFLKHPNSAISRFNTCERRVAQRILPHALSPASNYMNFLFIVIFNSNTIYYLL